MNVLARGRFVQKAILTRFCSSVLNEVIPKLAEKDQKAGVEMKKVVTPIPGEAWVFVQADCPTVEPSLVAEGLGSKNAVTKMKNVVTPKLGEAWVFVQADCPAVEAPLEVEALVSKLKDQKAVTEMKKVVTPLQGEVWVFIQADDPSIEAEAVASKESKLMGQVISKMDEIYVASSTAKKAAQLIGLGADLNEHGLEKVVKELLSTLRVVDKDRDKLYANTNFIVQTTDETRELVKNQVLVELAHLRAEMKEIASSKKGRGSFPPKTGVKKGEKGNGTDSNGNGGGEYGGGTGGDNGGDAGSNGDGGGWGLRGMLRHLGGIFFGNGKVE